MTDFSEEISAPPTPARGPQAVAAGDCAAVRRALADGFGEYGSWRVTSVEPTGLSTTERPSSLALADIAIEAITTAGFIVLTKGPFAHLQLMRCEGCGDLWLEDELQQVQPDGHDACPICEDDPDLTHVDCVVHPVASCARAGEGAGQSDG